MKILFQLFIFIYFFSYNLNVFAYTTTNAPEIYNAYNKQQIITKDSKGHLTTITPHFKSNVDRNMVMSEKEVCIESKNAYAPYYGFYYTLYTPIGNYVGHHRRVQHAFSGYGYDPIPCGCEGDLTPKFKTIKEAKHYYYPQWY